jgi:hypothetical protein
MVTLHFERNAAENRGVKIECIKSNYYKYTLPTGVVFESFHNNQFDYTESNQEAKEWFLKNVRGAFLSC